MNDPAKNDILIAESSYERIAGPLSDRLPEVRSICWHPDGSLTLDGRPVDTGAVNPVAGWISFDVLLGGHIESYAAAVGSFDSLEWLQSANAGLDHPVYPPLASRGVRLTKSGSQSIPITEYVIANVLYRYQRIEDRRTAEASKRWSGLPFRELWHTTWLTVGFGHIG